MEGTKLDIASKEKEPLSPTATYKQLPEDDMDEKTKNNSGTEPDGADEKMLLDDAKVGPNSNTNLTEIKFTKSDNDKNGDAKLDLGEVVKNEFVGLTKEELMKCANDPFWVRLRWILFVSFWLLWAGMLVGAILIIIAAPKCTPPTPKTWWEEGPITTVDYAHLEEAEKLASDKQVLIIPYPSDTYALLNATPTFASFLAKHKDANIIVELNPSVSDAWFADSESKVDKYADYYIWQGQEGSEDIPNNWLAKDSSDDDKQSAWKYSTNRRQFYLSPDGGKPQLNFRNKKVREEFKSVMAALLDAGVDGFTLRNVPGLLVDAEFADEEAAPMASDYSINNYNFYTHHKTVNLKELQPVVQEWRDMVKNKSADGVLMLSDELTTLDPFKFNGTLLVDLPKQRNVFANKNLNAVQLVRDVNATYNSLNGNWPAWNVANSGYPNGTLAIVAYLLKGSPIVEANFDVREELKEARKSPSVLYGTQTLYTAANDTVFAYVRTYPGNPGYLVAFNPTEERVEVDFPQDIPQIPNEVTVQYFSSNYNETDVGIRLKKSAHQFPISAKSSIILSYVPNSK